MEVFDLRARRAPILGDKGRFNSWRQKLLTPIFNGPTAQVQSWWTAQGDAYGLLTSFRSLPFASCFQNCRMPKSKKPFSSIPGAASQAVTSSNLKYRRFGTV